MATRIIINTFFDTFELAHSGGNGKNIDKSSEATRRTQADVKSVEAALHLQSQQSIEQCEMNTDESATLTDDINDDTEKPVEKPFKQFQWVCMIIISFCAI